MNIFLSLLLLAAGIVLLFFGMTATESIANAFSKLFTGEYTDRTVWLLIGGSVLTLAGVVGSIRYYQS